MERTHARAPAGARAVCKRSAGYSSNISVVGAVSLNGFEHTAAFDGSVDTERFLLFLDGLIPKLSKGHVLVMDNVRFHHSVAVKSKLAAAEIRVLYLPPYHPELNPIEEVWSHIKTTLRSYKARTIPRYVTALQDGLGRIKSEMMEAYFRHAGYGDQPL